MTCVLRAVNVSKRSEHRTVLPTPPTAEFRGGKGMVKEGERKGYGGEGRLGRGRSNLRAKILATRPWPQGNLARGLLCLYERH